ncbi:pentatricopeptide repeat-containing protein at1g62670 mitochondrial [Phtheirospermum japonicum]|uniref:Pentatricopeptide repeat-containing protein at1g62670 mitochondrial n=1 Tax=Phtheirospermum japonicum TaxID=374723 RepID=A0A830BKM9_9LAMI|nr:pentatricopeptide repeat-containing protein at1g62670 mitochondrial [Phtheirospermum japonicum]
MRNTQFAHAIQISYKKTKVYLWPSATQTGMKASKTIKAILSFAGYKNVKSKLLQKETSRWIRSNLRGSDELKGHKLINRKKRRLEKSARASFLKENPLKGLSYVLPASRFLQN